MKAALFLLLVLWTGKTGAELITGIPYADFEDNDPVSLSGERLQPETRLEVNRVEAYGGMQSAHRAAAIYRTADSPTNDRYRPGDQLLDAR